MGIDWDAMVLAPVVAVFGEGEIGIMYYPAGGTSFPINLVYDEANLDLPLAGGQEVNSSNPIVSGRVAAFQTQPQQGDTLTVVRTGETFQVKDVDTDGKGSVVLRLNYLSGP